MTLLEAFGWIFGAMVVLTVLCLIVQKWEKIWDVEEYDERQQIARLRAYRLGFFVGLVYLVALLFLDDALAGVADSGDLMVMGVVLELTVVDIYCLLSRAALPFGKDHKTVGIWWLVMGGIYLYNAERSGWWNSWESGVVDLSQVCWGAASLTLAAGHFISAVWREKED